MQDNSFLGGLGDFLTRAGKAWWEWRIKEPAERWLKGSPEDALSDILSMAPMGATVALNRTAMKNIPLIEKAKSMGLFEDTASQFIPGMLKSEKMQIRNIPAGYSGMKKIGDVVKGSPTQLIYPEISDKKMLFSPLYESSGVNLKKDLLIKTASDEKPWETIVHELSHALYEEAGLPSGTNVKAVEANANILKDFIEDAFPERLLARISPESTPDIIKNWYGFFNNMPNKMAMRQFMRLFNKSLGSISPHAKYSMHPAEIAARESEQAFMRPRDIITDAGVAERISDYTGRELSPDYILNILKTFPDELLNLLSSRLYE